MSPFSFWFLYLWFHYKGKDYKKHACNNDNRGDDAPCNSTANKPAVEQQYNLPVEDDMQHNQSQKDEGYNQMNRPPVMTFHSKQKQLHLSAIDSPGILAGQ